VLRADVRVDEHLGIAQVRRAIDAIEGGDPDPELFAVVGDRWDVEERSRAELHRVGLPDDVLDRRLGELSGGEVTQLALARLLLDAPDVLLLDEPTNNLDRDARERLVDVVDGWRGSLLVVSHDRELLEHVDRIGELREWTAGARCGGTAAAGRRTPSRWRASRRRRAGRARRRVRRTPPAQRPGHRAGGAVPPQEAGRPGGGHAGPAEDRHRGAQARGPGVGRQVPGHPPGPAG
jgi:ATPase subunit of ABC transporter with duplicated ATPase domains